MEKQVQYDFAAVGTSVWPQQRCKTLHLVRHAQGIHNVASEMNHNLLSSFDYFDAHLSPLGFNQVDSLREHVLGSGLSKRIELVITSPMLRTMQTALGAFGHDVKARNSLNSPPFMAVELCRERLGVNPCDKRRSIDEYKSLFPAFDFSQIESNEDILWKPDVRERDGEVADRGLKFFNWLWTLKEKEIAIVTHSAFLHETLKYLSKDCHPSVKNEMSAKFLNCELRSLVIIERSFVGSIYPEKLDNGIDLPSNTAQPQ